MQSKVTPGNVAALIVAAAIIGGALYLLAFLGLLATIVLAAMALAIAYHVIPPWAVGLLALALVLELVLPNLGLIGFDGGFLSAIVGVLAIGIGSICTSILFSWLGVTDEVNAAIANARKSSIARAIVARWLAWSAVLGLGLWVAALVDDNIILFGFVPTAVAGMVLSGVREFFQFINRRFA